MGRLTGLRAKIAKERQEGDKNALVKLFQALEEARLNAITTYRKYTGSKSATVKLSETEKWSLVYTMSNGMALFKSKHNNSTKVMRYKINKYQNNNPLTR